MHAAGFFHPSTHNFFLDSMIEYGVTYVSLLLVLVAYALWSGFRKKIREFPLLVFLFVSSNFIVISVGGIGLLSFMYSAAVLICALNLRVPIPSILTPVARDQQEPLSVGSIE
jgi:hypothetical protein